MSMIPLLLAAAVITNYDCTVEAPRSVNRQGTDRATVAAIGLPGGGDWAFKVRVAKDSKGIQAEVIWPKDPIQVAGKFAALPIASGAITFVAVAGGPCLFTDQACATMVQLVDQPDGKATILLTPAAITTDKNTNRRSSFIVISAGTCARTEENK